VERLELEQGCVAENVIFGNTKRIRRLRAKVAEKRRSFWDRLFGTNNRSGRQNKVLEYVIHRIEDGANLERCSKKSTSAATPLPRRFRGSSRTPGLLRPLVSKLREDFSSGRLNPRQRDVR
jgi:hypothetical protein